MKIGLVTQAYYPVLGGVTEHAWHLGKELQRRGHEVTVITGSAKDADDRGLRVLRHGFQIPMMSNGANVSVTIGWKLGRTLQKIEATERFDVVHVMSPLDPGLPLIASKAMRTPKVGTYHSARQMTGAISERVPVIFRPVFIDAIKKIQRHIAVSPAAEEFIHHFFPSLKMTIIPNGIDTRRFSPEVEPLPEYTDGVFTILYVGRMDPRKGAKYLFGALPYLEKELNGKYRVVVVGTGWMQKYYDAHIPLHVRKRVVFSGYASPEELPRYYRSASVYCSPATGNESFGIVLLESMATGTPVVASDISGYRWVVTPGVEGDLVPPRSSKHLADALIAMAKDPARRKRMGAAGHVKSLQYDWRVVTDRIEQVYREIITRG